MKKQKLRQIEIDNEMKRAFTGMLRVGRTVEDILADINSIESYRNYRPETIAETLRIIEDVRRENVGATG